MLPKSTKKKEKLEREVAGIDYGIQVIMQKMHDIEPETEEWQRLCDSLEKLRATRESLINEGKLTGEQKITIVKIFAYLGLGLAVAALTWIMPTAEKALKFLQILPK